MVPPNNLGPGLSGKVVNETQYRGMIRLLMYLTASRPAIQISTCLCVRYQANPKESYLIAVKRIFRYLKGTSSLGLWYPKCSGFDLKGYLDSDYTGCNMDRKDISLIIKYLVKISKKARILELKQRNMKIVVLTSNTPIRRIDCAERLDNVQKVNTPYSWGLDTPYRQSGKRD
ncbi:hypothetical protein Tco_1088618 [Tanacetum coccineum]